MKILNIIPIAKTISKGELTYFTSDEGVTVGSIVKVPIRKKTAHGLVVDIKNVEENKAEIKSAPFSIKKIEKLQSTTFLTPEFIESVKQASEYFATSPALILNSLIPKKILRNIDKIKTEWTFEKKEKTYDGFVTQADEEERYANYKSLIREEFAKKSSIFFCLPTLEDIKKARTLLEKGIEKYTFVLHNSLSEKDLINIWNNIMQETHPVLIISTGSFLCLPRKDIGTIIIERENSRAYKNQIRPYLDTRTFIEILSKKIKIKMLLGDSLLRTETIWRERASELAEFRSLKFRSLSTSSQTLVDMRQNREPGTETPWRILSEELETLIKDMKDSSENLFIFGVRKGLFPTTICGDCGHTVLCHNCEAPTVLHSVNKTNFFLCHKCGEKRSAEEKCAHCESWKLTPLGVGIDNIKKEIEEKFPNVKIFKMDKDSVSTHKRAVSIMEKFNSTPGSILLGTEMALLYLNDKVENAAVVSIDPLFSIPDFRINEKIMYILLKMRSLARRKFIVQTRNPEQKVLDYALKGNLLDFYRDEIEQRKIFGYPPYSVIVKITLQGQKAVVTKEMEKLTELFKPNEFITFPSYTSLFKGKYSMNGILKIEREKWPDKEIIEKIGLLPAQIMVKIDPESVL